MVLLIIFLCGSACHVFCLPHFMKDFKVAGRFGVFLIIVVKTPNSELYELYVLYEHRIHRSKAPFFETPVF